MRLPFFLRFVFNRYFFEKMAAFALLGLFAYALSDFLFIFLVTFLFAFLFLDLSTWITKRIEAFSKTLPAGKFRSGINAVNRISVVVTGVYLIFIIAVVFLFSNLVPQVLQESKGIVSEVPGIVTHVEKSISGIESALKIDLGLKSAITSYFDKDSMEKTAKDVFENLRNAGIVLGKIFIALVLSYVFIIDRNKIAKYLETVKRGNFAFLYQEYAVVLTKIGKGFGLIFKAQALIALVNAILTTLGLLLISAVHWGNVFPYISTLGVMVFIMGFVPVLGFIISTIPILIVGYNYGGQSVIWLLLLMIVVVHAVEAYYLNPKIVSSYMELPVFITFLILLISEHFFGFVGLLIGVPLFYIIIDVAKDLDLFVHKVKKVSSAIDTTKTSTKEAIHKNIRLSRSQGPTEE